MVLGEANQTRRFGNRGNHLDPQTSRIEFPPQKWGNDTLGNFEDPGTLENTRKWRRVTYSGSWDPLGELNPTSAKKDVHGALVRQIHTPLVVS